MRHEILRYLLVVLPYVLATTLAALIIWGEDIKKLWPRLIAFALMSSFTQTLTYQIETWSLQFPVEVASGFLVAWVFFRRDLIWLFKIYATSYILGIAYAAGTVMIASLFSLPLGLVVESEYYWLRLLLPAYAMLPVLTMIIRKFLGEFKSFRYYFGQGLERPYPVFLALFIQLVVFMGIFTQLVLDSGISSTQSKLVATLAACVLLVLYSFYMVINYYNKQNVMTAVSAQEGVSEHLMDLVNTVRGERHDILNQLQVIYGLAYQDKTAELKEYLDELIPEISTYSELFKIDNPVISALINGKISQANTKGVEIDVDIQANLSGLREQSMDFARILANLIDNAVESVLNDDVGKKVNVSIFEQDHFLVCRVENASTKIIDTEKIFLPGVTSKDDHSGLGLFNCRKLADKLSGKLEVRQEERKVTFAFLLTQKE